jgi:hypothetical protein
MHSCYSILVSILRAMSNNLASVLGAVSSILGSESSILASIPASIFGAS